MKTKAAILQKLNGPLILEEIETQPLVCGQVLVEIRQSSICGAQLNEIAGTKGEDRWLPHLLGHEGGGVVLEIGPGVTNVQPGDHVVMHWRKGTGIHATPAKYNWNNATVNSGWVTTFSGHSVASENRLTPIPKDIPFEIAALMGCVVTTALGLINNLAKLKIGQSIAVLGCGGVGLNVIQGAAMVSAGLIIAIDIYDTKLEMARQLGATHLINSNQMDVDEEIQKITGNKGVDVFVENTGLVRLIEQAYRLTNSTGKTICVGVPRHDENVTIHTLPLHHGKVITGCEGGDANPTEDIPRYLNLYKKGILQLDQLITHQFPLEEINDALDIIRAGEAGRCVLSMEH